MMIIAPCGILSQYDEDQHNLFHLLHVGRIQGQVGGGHGGSQLDLPLLGGKQSWQPDQYSCFPHCALISRESRAVGDGDKSASDLVLVIAVEQCDQGAPLVGREFSGF